MTNNALMYSAVKKREPSFTESSLKISYTFLYSAFVISLKACISCCSLIRLSPGKKIKNGIIFYFDNEVHR